MRCLWLAVGGVGIGIQKTIKLMRLHQALAISQPPTKNSKLLKISNKNKQSHWLRTKRINRICAPGIVAWVCMLIVLQLKIFKNCICNFSHFQTFKKRGCDHIFGAMSKCTNFTKLNSIESIQYSRGGFRCIVENPIFHDDFLIRHFWNVAVSLINLTYALIEWIN